MVEDEYDEPDSKVTEPFSRDDALKLLKEFEDFADGVDDEINEKIKKVRQFIVDKLGNDEESTFAELQHSCPNGVYAPVEGRVGSSTSRLIVLNNNNDHRTAVLFFDIGSCILQTAEESWAGTKFVRVKNEVFTGEIREAG